MKFRIGKVAAVGVVLVGSVVGTVVLVRSFWAAGILLFAWLGTGIVFENVGRYLPGGTKNPYRADTVDKANVGTKVFVWIAAVCLVTLIWGASFLGIIYLR